jgi:hypothetical protein
MILRSLREEEKLEKVINKIYNQELIKDATIQKFLKNTAHLNNDSNIELNLNF